MGFEAIVSDSDYEHVSKFRWFVVKKQYKKYAKTYHNKEYIYMHRMILKKPYIDHINGDGLDNRIENLREATKSQNMANRGLQKNNQYGYKGISFDKRPNMLKPWFSRIKVNGKQINLGRSETKEQAAKKYNDAAIKYFGEFAYLNVID